MELSTHIKGLSTELAVQKAFIDHGFGVSIPLLPTSRYDMIVDLDGILAKVQVKTARPIPNSDGFMISLTSSRTHRWGVTAVKYSDTDVDFFATSYNDNVYVIPKHVAGDRSSLYLRYSSANNQTSGILFANDYELNNTLAKNHMCLTMN